MTERMDHFWLAIFAALTFVASVSPLQVTLADEPGANGWHWGTERTPGKDISGWTTRANPTRYVACDVSLPPSNPHPDNWLISDQIAIRDANRIDIIVDYFITSCSTYPNNGGSYCEDAFDLYVNHSNQLIADKSQYPDPLSNRMSYEKVTVISQATDKRYSEAINFLPKRKYVILAFHNYGACSTLFSVKVSYNVCPDEALNNSLVLLPRTAAPANDSQPIKVEGNCNRNSVQVSGSLHVNCESNGQWNTNGLAGRCVCKEDMQNNEGICEVCPGDTYNDGRGFGCTILPSAPRNVTIKFVNQSTVEIRWLPPVITGDQTHVYYDVSCRKQCDSHKDCLEEYCERGVNYIPNKEGLKVTQVIVADLFPFGNYSFAIYAKNRVSEVAKRGHGVEGSFIAIVVRTNGSTPAATTTAPTTEANSKTAMYLNIIYGFGGLVGLLVVLIVFFACCKIVIRWRGRQAEVKQIKLPIANESRVRVYDDVTMFSVVAYQNVDDTCDGFHIDRDQVTLVRLLGTGNFGQVSKAIYGTSHSEVAVKSLKDNASQTDLRDMLSELEVMKSLQPHPHVVRLVGCCIDREPMLIVLEYLPYGDLLGYLRKSRGHEDTYNTGEKRPNSRLTEKDLLSFAWMIADGMNYLATMKVVHRDLAARNVLVGENKVCKISDFGLARGLEGDVYTRRTQARLPVKWMPPESLFYAESTTMSDVWSYGIVMWEVFTIGESPYPGVPSRQVAGLLQTGYRMPRPRHISAELYAIMTECWEEQPKKRPTFQWLCSAIRTLLDDHKTYVNLEVYDDKDYVNFDVVT